MVELPSSATPAIIEAVREELGRFQSQQRDPAVVFCCAAISAYLTGALKGQGDPWLRQMLARDVGKLALAVRNAHVSIPVANETHDRPRVTSVMIGTLAPDFADATSGVA
jgi:hypothetical protein